MSFNKYWPNIHDNINPDRFYKKIGLVFYNTLFYNKPFKLNGLTMQDFGDMCNMQCVKDTNSIDLLLNKFISNGFGEIYKGSLYRGLSKDDREKTVKSNILKLRHASSFSEDKYMAENFGDYIITIKSCSKPIFDLSYFCKVIEQLVADFNLDKLINKYHDQYLIFLKKSGWFKALFELYQYAKKQNNKDPLLTYKYNQDVNEFRINEAISYDEYEWLIPKDTQLHIVDITNYIFKI